MLRDRCFQPAHDIATGKGAKGMVIRSIPDSRCGRLIRVFKKRARI